MSYVRCTYVRTSYLHCTRRTVYTWCTKIVRVMNDFVRAMYVHCVYGVHILYKRRTHTGRTTCSSCTHTVRCCPFDVLTLYTWYTVYLGCTKIVRTTYDVVRSMYTLCTYVVRVMCDVVHVKLCTHDVQGCMYIAVHMSYKRLKHYTRVMYRVHSMYEHCTRDVRCDTFVVHTLYTWCKNVVHVTYDVIRQMYIRCTNDINVVRTMCDVVRTVYVTCK